MQQTSSHTYYFRAGQLTWQLRAAQPLLQLHFEPQYKTFMCLQAPAVVDSEIEIYKGIPEKYTQNKTVFATKNTKHPECFSPYSWSIHQNGSKFFIQIDYRDTNRPSPCVVAAFNTNASQWQLYFSHTEGIRIAPLFYPLDSLIIYYTGLFRQAALVHASAVIWRGRGLLFSGFSGVGKSTMAQLWQRRGAQVINDDRILIQQSGTRFIAANTPMLYVQKPRENPLNAIFLLQQGPENRLTKLNHAVGVTRLLAFCIQHTYRKAMIEKLMALLIELCNAMPVYELEFTLNHDVTRFLEYYGK